MSSPTGLFLRKHNERPVSACFHRMRRRAVSPCYHFSSSLSHKRDLIGSCSSYPISCQNPIRYNRRSLSQPDLTAPGKSRRHSKVRCAARKPSSTYLPLHPSQPQSPARMFSGKLRYMYSLRQCVFYIECIIQEFFLFVKKFIEPAPPVHSVSIVYPCKSD